MKCPALTLAIAVAIAAAPTGQAATHPSLWHELDIVPMPRDIELTGREVGLQGAVIVLGEAPSRQDQIGAEWINGRLADLDCAPLAVGGQAPLRIVVGTVASNPRIAQAAQVGTIKVGPGTPGERGYVIHPGDGEVLLAGADEIGALYACVTFAELIVARGAAALWREARVTDRPDFVHATLGGSHTGSTEIPELRGLVSELRGFRGDEEPPQEFRERYLAGMNAFYNRLLRWKVGSLWCGRQRDGFELMSPAALALFREAVEYGKERGIGALFYDMAPFAGRVADYPDYDGPKLPPGSYPGWIRCWSQDGMRRQTADAFARGCAAAGFTDIGFHDSDTGGFTNPAQWEERCEVCRQRWGDNYAAATVNKFRIYYDALKRHCQDARMHVVIEPYRVGIYTQEGGEGYLISCYGPGPGVPDAARRLREEWTTFYRRVTEMLPPDINFCIREAPPENVQAFREIIRGRPLFVFFMPLSKPWTSFFSEGPRWTGTFFRDSRDFIFTPTLETFVPVQALAGREYSWNINAPGAEPFTRLPIEEEWRHCEPEGEIYALVLPHVTRNLFGRRAADQIVGALACNINPFEIFGDKFYGGRVMFLTTWEKMKWQMELAEEGAALLDEAWTLRAGPDDMLGMDDYAFRRFVYLREIFHCCRWMATAKAHTLHARELAREGKREEAEAAISAGLAAVEQGRGDLKMLLADRPEDPIYEGHNLSRGSGLYRIFTPGVEVDYDVVKGLLEQTRGELPTLLAASGIDQGTANRLDRLRIVHAGTARGPIAVDGRLDEPGWDAVYPAESFLVHGESLQIAAAPTSARLMYDDANIYLGFSCWLPEGGEPVAEPRARDDVVSDDDGIEVFLSAPGLQGGYIHLMINALGSVRDQIGVLGTDDTGIQVIRCDPSWDAEGLQVTTALADGRWDAEISVPLSNLGVDEVGSGWTANLARNYRSPRGVQDWSSTQPSEARDSHDHAKYRRIYFTDADFTAPAPMGQVEIAGATTRTETFDDRIITVCRFGLDLYCSRVLHDVTITAESYDAQGKLHQRSEVTGPQAVHYNWQPEEPLEVPFNNEVEAGGVRVIVKAAERTLEHWLRFGGWEGTPEVDPVLVGEGRDGGALADGLVFVARLKPEGAGETSIFESRQGTVEFWLRPDWPREETRFARNFEMWTPQHIFLHFGPLRPDYPYMANHSSVCIDHSGYRSMRFSVHWSTYSGWWARAEVPEIEQWAPGSWHHIAAVWDAVAPEEQWVRLYVDGRQVSGLDRAFFPERLGDDPAPRVVVDLPYAVQVGSFTSGRAPADSLIDELRISRVARYTGDFIPSATPFTMDADTGMLMHFDGDLTGTGRTAAGIEYTVTGVPGVVEYH